MGQKRIERIVQTGHRKSLQKIRRPSAQSGRLRKRNDRRLDEYGQITLENNQNRRKIQLLTIIGRWRGMKFLRKQQDHQIRPCAPPAGLH